MLKLVRADRSQSPRRARRACLGHRYLFAFYYPGTMSRLGHDASHAHPAELMRAQHSEEEGEMLQQMGEGTEKSEQAIRRVRRLASAWAARRSRVRPIGVSGPD
eukprot:6909203-Pyramimonas_sp.AAC.1